MQGNGKFSKRILFLDLIIVSIAAVLIGRLYSLQVVRGADYRDKAEGQYQLASDPFDRNTIYFTEKNGNLVAAATLKNGFVLVINPGKFAQEENPEKFSADAVKKISAEDAYEKMNALFPLDREEFMLKMSKTGDPYEEVAHRIPEETARKIKNLDIDGVSIYREHWRYYPGGNSASHILGFVGYESDGVTLSGRYGLESYYDILLNKNDGGPKMNFFAEVFSSVGNVIDPSAKIKGDIALTIEPTVQSSLEKQLADTKEKYNGGEIGGIIMDPKTGEIYAMASLPNFDPNDVSREENVSVFNNPLIGSRYEMGSVVKPLAMAAAIDAGSVTASSTYNDNLGYIIVDKEKISNYDGKGRGNKIPMQEVLNQSLNTGMVYVMKQMGRTKFSSYMNAYGLGETTKIDLHAEAAGDTENLKEPRDVEHATAAFGHGISLTPIGITRALSSLGNGGYLPEPHLLKQTIYPAGITKDNNLEPGPRVLKPETSEKITRMLVTVVDKALLNGTVKIPNYSVAAKTGTAEISQGGGKGYYTDRYLHSFFGYFPAYDPKFIVFLYVVNPQGEEFASHTLTDPFMQLAKFLLTYYEIPPDR